MIIQHNMPAMNTNRQLGISAKAGQKSTEKLSSGYRINRAGDDAAGLAISEKMRSQIRGLNRASANSQDGISLIQTAEGALNETQSILQRMRELAVQAANGTNTDSDRNEIQKEVNQLTSEINRIANTTEFNTMKLLKGNGAGNLLSNVDSSMLSAGTGKGGDIGDFNVDIKSVNGVESMAKLMGATGKVTGKIDTSMTQSGASAVRGERSSVVVAGLKFEASGIGTDLENVKIQFAVIAENGTEGIASGAILTGGGHIDGTAVGTITIGLKQSTIDTLTHAQDLISIINGFDSSNQLRFSGGSAAATSFSLKDDLHINVTQPKGVATGTDIKSALPSEVGKTLDAPGIMKGGKDEVLGHYKFKITDAFKEAGDTIKIFGQTFKAVDSNVSTVNSGVGEFDMSSKTANGQAAALVATMQSMSAFSGKFDIKIDGSDPTQITIVEKAGYGGEIAKLGTSIEAEGSGGGDNYITITNPDGTNGVEFKIMSGTGALKVEQDSTNKNQITITLGARAEDNTAEKIQKQIRLLGTKTIDLKQDPDDPNSDPIKVDFSNVVVKAGGNWDTETTGKSNIQKDFGATGGGIRSEKGKYSFTIKNSMTDGDKVTIAGKTFVAKADGANALKGEIDVSSTDISTQAAALQSVLMLDKDISAKFDIKVANGKVSLVEKQISGTDLKAKDISIKTAGGGKYKVNLNEMLQDGSALMIDGKKINVSSKNEHLGYADGTAIKVTDTLDNQAAAIADAINKNTEMDYVASVDEDGNLLITQSQMTDKEPEISIVSSDKGTFDVTFQVGANTGQSMTIAIGDTRAAALGVAGDGSEKSIVADNGAKAFYTENQVVTDGTSNDNIEYALDVTSYEKATAAIGVIDDALAAISAQRSQLGAYQNRLEHTIANLDNTSENLQASESRIRDVDMAKEMSEFSKNNILQQAAQSMLAQANQSTQGVLTLLR